MGRYSYTALVKRIADYCHVRIGHAFRGRVHHEVAGDVRVIQPRDISHNGQIAFGEAGPLRLDVPSPRFLQPNDVLLVNKGRFASAVFDFTDVEQWLAPSSVLVLTLCDGTVLPHYLACFFNSPAGQKMLRRHGELTTIPYISASNLGNMKIPIPSLERQKSLASLSEATAQFVRLSNRKHQLYSAIVGQEFNPEPRKIS